MKLPYEINSYNYFNKNVNYSFSEIESILINIFKDRCKIRLYCSEFSGFLNFHVIINDKFRIGYNLHKYNYTHIDKIDYINHILEEVTFMIEKFLHDDFYYFLEEFNK